MRCFLCRVPGHRARVCLHRQVALSQPRRALVWRPVTQAAPAKQATASPGMGEGAGGGDGGGGGKRTRSGRRKQGSHRGGGFASLSDRRALEDSGPPLPLVEEAAPNPVHSTRPMRIIRRSASIAHSEDELRRAQIISVVGRDDASCAVEVSDALTLRFNLEADALDIRRAAPNSFIVFLPTEELACQVYNEGRPFIAPSIRLHIRSWSRQALAAGGGALPFLVHIKLQGIPAHVWEIKTVEQLLSDYCLVQVLHQDTEERLDFHSFKLTAWCIWPELVPESMDLHIIEPLVAAADDPVTARTLFYPIAISVSPAELPPVARPLAPSPPDSPDDDDRDHDLSKRRHRQRTPPSSSSPGAANSQAADVASLGPVHARHG